VKSFPVVEDFRRLIAMKFLRNRKILHDKADLSGEPRRAAATERGENAAAVIHGGLTAQTAGTEVTAASLRATGTPEVGGIGIGGRTRVQHGADAVRHRPKMLPKYIVCACREGNNQYLTQK
jgi:hypothetical protein